MRDAAFFKAYTAYFEERVVAYGVDSGMIGKEEVVSLRPGKLSATGFGIAMGGVIETGIVCAIDYYGHIKKSVGFFKMAEEITNGGGQVKSLSIPVVHFASLKIEKVARVAPDLVTDFPRFKKNILDMRGFSHNYEG